MHKDERKANIAWAWWKKFEVLFPTSGKLLHWCLSDAFECAKHESVGVVLGFPTKLSAFDQEWNKSLLFNFQNFVLDKAYPNLDFEIKIVEIRWKLSEIYYFEL